MNLAPRNFEAVTNQMSGTQLASLTDIRPDTVSPHDDDALEMLFDTWAAQGQLSSLIRGAVQSRKLADEHRRSAQELIRAARSARERGSLASYKDKLVGARDARRKAYRCYVYACRCEDRANALAASSGFRPALGH
ncbi:MAG: hypothetical protein KIT00_00320 [Rhodospirillales bacterium]|nr:hypothetical protein [Rhodospirillales bacterium]